MKYTASRLSEGNKIFPAEIHIEEHGVTVKIPGLFGGESKFFAYEHIASIDVDAPMIGFSTVTFYAGGTWISAHGFTSSEVKQMKTAVEQGKSSAKNFSGGSNGGTVVVNNQTNADDVKIKELEMQQALKEKELQHKKEREEQETKDKKINEIITLAFPEDAKGIYNTLNILSLKAITSFKDDGFDKEIYSQCIGKFDQGLKELKFLFNSDSKAQMYYDEAILEKNKIVALKRRKKAALGIFLSLLFGVILSVLLAAALQVGPAPLILGLIITTLLVIWYIYNGYIRK